MRQFDQRIRGALHSRDHNGLTLIFQRAQKLADVSECLDIREAAAAELVNYPSHLDSRICCQIMTPESILTESDRRARIKYE